MDHYGLDFTRNVKSGCVLSFLLPAPATQCPCCTHGYQSAPPSQSTTLPLSKHEKTITLKEND